MVYNGNVFQKWKAQVLHEMIGHSLKLKDIRLLYHFKARLTPKQQVLLDQNGQKYHVEHAVNEW